MHNIKPDSTPETKDNLPVDIQKPQAASDERWYQTKAFKRFRRNPLAITGTSLLIFFLFVSIFAPMITTSQIATRYRGHTCARDLAFPIESEDWGWYQRTGLPNFAFWELERLPRGEEAIPMIRNPLKGYFWRVMLIPPVSCMNIPRDGFMDIPQAPSAAHPMGLAPGGYDIFYGMVWGSRVAFYVGIFVVSISLTLGLIIGGAAGFFGGWIDNVLMRVADTIYAFPNLILAMVFITIFGTGLFKALFALAIVGWVGYARILRGDILRVRELEYVDAGRSLGMGNLRLFFKHVFPNASSALIIIASLDIGTVVLTNAGLAFLGLGAEIGFSDWGQMINFARSFILGSRDGFFTYWYVVFWPGLALLLFGLAWNLLGDAYRDAVDTRMQ